MPSARRLKRYQLKRKLASKFDPKTLDRLSEALETREKKKAQEALKTPLKQRVFITVGITIFLAELYFLAMSSL